MLRRWLIRSLFLLPLAFFVATWITSYCGAVAVYVTRFHHTWGLGAFQGEIDGFRLAPSGTSGFAIYPKMTLVTWNSGASRWHFALGTHPMVSSAFIIAAPLWLPTLLLAAVSLLVWRRTRPKPTARAFPIEPSAAPKSKIN